MQLVYLNMEGERRRRQVLRRQARELVYKVFSYFNREADAGMPVHFVAKSQERTGHECNIIIGSVQRIISDGNVAICISSLTHSLSLSLSLALSLSPPAFVRVGHFNTPSVLVCISSVPSSITEHKTGFFV
jgi:hypothetical protein